MMEILADFGITGESAIPLLALLLLAFGFVRIIHDPDNPIEFWHFFSSWNERERKAFGDINSLGMMAGILAALFVILWTTYKNASVDPWVLGVCLVYLGGVKAFSSWLRMVAGQRYGVTAPEKEVPAPPAPPVVTTTTTTTVPTPPTPEPPK